jgi:hypothetical protein
MKPTSWYLLPIHPPSHRRTRVSAPAGRVGALPGPARRPRSRAALALGVGGLLALACASARAEDVVVPEFINYQGRLETLNAAKSYTNGLYDLQFRLWDQPSNGNFLWGEKYSVYVSGSRFNVVLGSGGAPLPGASPTFNTLREALHITAATANKERHLGITVLQDEDHQPINQPSESYPRQQLLNSGYAIQAQYAQYAAQAPTNGNFVANNGLQVLGAQAKLDKGVRVSGGVADLQAGLIVSGTNATFAQGLKVTGGSTALQTGVNVSGGTAVIGNGLDVTGTTMLRGGGTLNGAYQFQGGSVQLQGGPLRLDVGENYGLTFPENPWGGGGDRAWLTYSRNGTTGEDGKLTFGIANDATDQLSLVSSGSVQVTASNAGVNISAPSGAINLTNQHASITLKSSGEVNVRGDLKMFGGLAQPGNKSNVDEVAPRDCFYLVYCNNAACTVKITVTSGEVLELYLRTVRDDDWNTGLYTFPVGKGDRFQVGGIGRMDNDEDWDQRVWRRDLAFPLP